MRHNTTVRRARTKQGLPSWNIKTANVGTYVDSRVRSAQPRYRTARHHGVWSLQVPSRVGVVVSAAESSRTSSIETTDNAKRELLCLLETSVLDKGVFGVDEDVEDELAARIHALETCESVAVPTSTAGMQILSGRWRVLFTSVVILGAKRTKLALSPSGGSSLSGVVKLGEMYQSVSPQECKALNEVEFNVMGMVNGKFVIRAAYETVDERRVAVETEAYDLEPEKLKVMLGDNMKLLLKIFEPDGFLDITFLDEDLRVGRNDKGDVFVLAKDDAAPVE
eukprot:CAMPEP_0185854268 /NCGR_PEP_ID=MMETSP1354-20130828/21853_1 /TAXON_ID=708628 /ORGANISM="Erythrolobus madagascarensis, Strain CCMP3276" /LENGTH=279 /DNA_ID=CAMNT_0028555991 /DNA_START=39 /DNA_END=878 /DNA_ORIENTATION=-